jgi:hypothetical protein
VFASADRENCPAKDFLQALTWIAGEAQAARDGRRGHRHSSFSLVYGHYGNAIHATTCSKIKKAANGIVAAFHQPRGIKIKTRTPTAEIGVELILNQRNTPRG